MTRTQAVNAVLDALRANLGLGETPPGSNDNFIVQWYNDNVERIGRGPWCQMTVTWAIWSTVGRIVTGRAYTVWAAQDFLLRNEGAWSYDLRDGQPGDMIFYDWSQRKGDTAYIDHVGVIERVNGDGTVYTLEGNYGDHLVRMHRDAKYVVGVGRPDWSKVVSGGGASAPVSHPRPKPKPAAPRRLVVDGKPGPNYVRRKQQWLGTTADGVVSGQTPWILQHNPGLRARGRDVWALGGHGSDMIRADQRRLARKGLYRGAIDGLAGPKYWTALQAELHTSRDGTVSDPSDVIRADQRRLNQEK